MAYERSPPKKLGTISSPQRKQQQKTKGQLVTRLNLDLTTGAIRATKPPHRSERIWKNNLFGVGTKFHCTIPSAKWLEGRHFVTPAKFNSSPLKIDRAPKGKVCLPTNIFSGANSLLNFGGVYVRFKKKQGH